MDRRELRSYSSTTGAFWKNIRIGGAIIMTVARYRSIAPRNSLGSKRGRRTIGTPRCIGYIIVTHPPAM
jgi:hypothetical protein